MAVIQFETGQRVRFDGNPTQRDVDEVAARIGVSKPKEQNFIQSLASPFIKTAETSRRAVVGIGGLAAAAGASALGKDDLSKRIFEGTAKYVDPNRAQSYGLLGETKPLTDVKEAAGVGLELASYLPGARAVATPVKLGFKGLLKKAAVAGLKEGAQSGFLGGAGRATQEKDSTLGDIATKSFVEAVAGGVLGSASGVGFGVAGRVFGAVAGRTVPRLRTARAAKLEQEIADEYTKALNLNKSQRTRQLRGSKDTALFLAREGVPINVSNGRLDATDAIEAISQKSRAENTAFKRLLTDSGEYVNLDKARRSALASVEGEGTAREAAIRKVNDEFDAYIRQNGDTLVKNADGTVSLPAARANTLKQDAWSRSRFNQLSTPAERTEAGASRIVGNSLKDGIEESVTDVNVKEMNQRLGDLAEASWILQSRDGQPVVGGRLTRLFARLTGSVIGANAGPLGGVAGTATADQLADLLQNPNVRTWYAQKLLKSLRGRQGGQGLVEEAQRILEERAAARSTRKLLGSGAGGPIPLGGPSSMGGPPPGGMQRAGEELLERSGRSTPAVFPPPKLPSRPQMFDDVQRGFLPPVVLGKTRASPKTESRIFGRGGLLFKRKKN